MTTYIESKPVGDGTYDHSEVIQAHKNGSNVELYSHSKNHWYELTAAPIFNHGQKYRAVIEDKTFIKQWSDVIKNMPQHPGIRDLVALEQLVFEKFQSGNAIPVERITLTRAEVNEVFPGLLK